MSATEVLRRMLDERGVEYFKHEDGEPLRKLEKADEPATSWHMGDASVCAVPIDGSDLFDLWIDHCTTEQAVEATLGQGECKNISDPPEGFYCSSCGWGDFAEPSHLLTKSKFTDNECGPNYCPNCGKAVKR